MQVVYKHAGRVTRETYREDLSKLLAVITKQAEAEKRLIYWETLQLSTDEVFSTGTGAYAWTLYLEVEAS